MWEKQQVFNELGVAYNQKWQEAAVWRQAALGLEKEEVELRKQLLQLVDPLQGPYSGFSRHSHHPTPQSRLEPWTERLFPEFQFGRPCLISQI